MISCVVYGCTNNSSTSDSSIKYHPFPKNELAQQWAEACGWQSTTLDINTAHVCSIHFDDFAYDTGIKVVNFVMFYIKHLKEDAVPTLFLPQTHILIKDGGLDLGDGLVMYTINSSNSTDDITPISVEDMTGEEEIFGIQPSTSSCNLETMETEDDLKEPPEKCDKLTDMDLLLLQSQNEAVKVEIQQLEEELQDLHNQLKKKEKEYARCENIYKNVETLITKKNKILPTLDQKSILSKVFSESQIKILFGQKKVHWSNDEMAVAYIIRHLSNKRCYNYLTQNLNIPLPGLSSIKRWVTVKKNKKKTN